MTDDECELVAAHEEPYRRIELRRYPDRWAMVHLRHTIDGGWYVRDIIECPTREN